MQVRLHGSRGVSSLVTDPPGTPVTPCIIRRGEERKKKGEVLHLFRCYTHTHKEEGTYTHTHTQAQTYTHTKRQTRDAQTDTQTDTRTHTHTLTHGEIIVVVATSEIQRGVKSTCEQEPAASCCHIGKCANSSFIHCRRSWRQSLSQFWLTYADALQQVSTSVSTLDLSPLQLQLQTSRTYFLPSFWHRNIPRCQGSTTWHRMNFKWKTLISHQLRGHAMRDLFLLKSQNPSLMST